MLENNLHVLRVEYDAFKNLRSDWGRVMVLWQHVGSRIPRILPRYRRLLLSLEVRRLLRNRVSTFSLQQMVSGVLLFRVWQEILLLHVT